MISISHLDFYFGKQKILDNVSLHVPKGSIYGFLGPNGAGKTTTIKTLLGLLNSSGGDIVVSGYPLNRKRLEILAQTGSLIENPSLYGHLTGRDNLALAARLAGIPSGRINEVLEITGMSYAANRKTRKYSNGMKQRLGIALALLPDPELLLLDEPVNGLDPEGIVEMRKLFARLNKQGKTIFISSHLLSEIEKLCTHVGIIHKGRMLFEGSMSQLHQSLTTKVAVSFETSDPSKAMEILTGEYNCEIHGNNLDVSGIERQDIPQINKLLAGKGLDIFSIQLLHHNLEEAFIQVISKPEE